MRTLVVALALVIAACGHNSVTDPKGGEVRLESALGFHIQATQEYLDNGGAVSQQHADLADRWWTSLMADFRRAGYPEAKADPSKFANYTFVWLYKPIGPDSSITCPGWTVLVGGCYDQFKPGFRVPGDYIDPDGWLGARPTAQPLKHEMTHHWCLKTMGHLCMTGDEHTFVMPNGRDIWEVQWYDAYPPAAAASLAASSATVKCNVSELQ